jgi:hypothetical protein
MPQAPQSLFVSAWICAALQQMAVASPTLQL